MCDTSGVSVMCPRPLPLCPTLAITQSGTSAARVGLLKNTFILRIINRDQCSLAQLPGKGSQPQSPDSNRSNHVHPANVKMLACKPGYNHPQQIDEAHHKYHRSDEN